MGNKHHEPDRPGSRAEGRRRQFEESRGLTGPRDLPLDDESGADDTPDHVTDESAVPPGSGDESDDAEKAPDEE